MRRERLPWPARVVKRSQSACTSSSLRPRRRSAQHLGEIGVKRMMNHKLSLGWSAWHEMYTEHLRKKRLLKAVARG